MVNKTYKLQYLPLFKNDLYEIVNCLVNNLQNIDAANKLVNDVEEAIMERLKFPLAYEPYFSYKKTRFTLL